MREELNKALRLLDVENDNHWTVDGEARLDTVRYLAAKSSITREDINNFAPGFNRASRKAELAGAVPPPPPAAPQEVNDASGQQTGSGDSENSPEQPEVEGERDRKTVREAVAEAFNRAEQTVLELERVQSQVASELREAYLERDRLHNEMIKIEPVETNQDAIQAYMAGQHKLMAERASIRSEIRESGVNLHLLTKLAAAAPIDEAMRRRSRISPKR